MGSSSLPVSIVLCTWNGARYLRALWDSLLAQTRLPDEIVVRDDASSDDTFAWLKNLGHAARERGVAVSLQRNERNLGFVRNFDSTLRHATGEVVFLCDQDDVWHPHKIATMLPQFEQRTRLLLLHGDARLVDAEGKVPCGTLFRALEASRAELRGIHRGRAFEVLLRRNLVTGATLAFRRTLLHQALPFPEEWVHDEWLAIIAAALGEVDCLETLLIDYRQHGANQLGMHKWTLAEKLRDMASPRKPFFALLSTRLEILLERLRKLDAPSRRSEAVQRKLEHLRVRLQLSPSLPRRASQVLREAAGGGYTRFSSGARSVIRDLVRSG